MRVWSIVVDVILGFVAGATLYALLGGLVPALRGRPALALVIVGTILFVARSRPGGSFARRARSGPLSPSAEPLRSREWSLNRAAGTDLATVTVPTLLVQAVAGLVVSGLVLAMLAPLLVRRGLSLERWMVYGVLAASVVLCVGPGLWRRVRAGTISRAPNVDKGK